MKYYLAYGSNLSVEHMAQRCPDARIVGKAILQDWKLTFRLHATIEPCKSCYVPVLVWEISEDDEKSLDVYEGYPTYYIKLDMKVSMTNLDGQDPQEITAMIYIMAGKHQSSMPTKNYYDLLTQGYTRFGFDVKILLRALNQALKETREAED